MRLTADLNIPPIVWIRYLTVMRLTAEQRRLDAARKRTEHWRRWGPYLAERQWGTVREDYSSKGEAWTHFPHEHAHQRAYRWGEDGIGGVSNRHQRICLL